jgi:hypothetical protein
MEVNNETKIESVHYYYYYYYIKIKVCLGDEGWVVRENDETNVQPTLIIYYVVRVLGATSVRQTKKWRNKEQTANANIVTT